MIKIPSTIYIYIQYTDIAPPLLPRHGGSAAKDGTLSIISTCWRPGDGVWEKYGKTVGNNYIDNQKKENKWKSWGEYSSKSNASPLFTISQCHLGVCLRQTLKITFFWWDGENGDKSNVKNDWIRDSSTSSARMDCKLMLKSRKLLVVSTRTNEWIGDPQCDDFFTKGTRVKLLAMVQEKKHDMTTGHIHPWFFGITVTFWVVFKRAKPRFLVLGLLDSGHAITL